MDANQAAEVLQDLIGEGRNALDQADFSRWRHKCRLALERIYGPNHLLPSQFEASTSSHITINDALEPDWQEDHAANLAAGLSLLEGTLYDQETLAGAMDVGADAFDPELWQHVAHDVEGEHWDKVPAGVATFVESKVREWSGLASGDYGKDLMVKVFKPDGGVFPCGDPSVKGEQQGWQQLATGFVQALSNVVRHRIQNRDDAKTYAMGALGAGSLLLTQLRYQHDPFDGDHLKRALDEN